MPYIDQNVHGPDARLGNTPLAESTTVCGEADNIVRAREEDYGPPYRTHDNIAAMWRAYLQTRMNSDKYVDNPQGTFDIYMLDAEDVAMMMDLVKSVRIAQRNGGESRDSFADKCGYSHVAHVSRLQRLFGKPNGTDAT